MPRLRGVGSSAKQILGLYLQDQFMRERLREQEAAITERQTSINDLNFVQGLLPDIQSGKFNPAALAPARRTALESYIDPTQVYPSVERRAGQVASEYLGKSKFEEIPDEQGILQAFQAAGIGEQEMEHPAIVNALNAIKARQESLRGFIPTTKVESYDPTTAASRSQFVPNNQLGGMSVQTSPTPQQAGQNQLTQALSGELSPEMTSAKAEQTNTLNRQTLGSEAAKAGAIAGSQANAQLPAQKDLFKFSQDMRQEDALELQEARIRAQQAMKQAEGMPGAVASEMMRMRIEALSESLSDNSNLIERGMNLASAKLKIDVIAAELDALSDAGGIGSAQAIGNKGPVSEADKQAGKAFVATVTDPIELRRRKNQRWKMLNTLAPKINQIAGPNASLDQRRVIMFQLLREAESGANITHLPNDPLWQAVPQDGIEAVPVPGTEPQEDAPDDGLPVGNISVGGR